MQSHILGASISAALAFTASAAPKRLNASDLAPFRGNYAGVFTLGIQTPPSTGYFFVARKRDHAVLTLASTIDQGASNTTYTERLELRGRKFIYTLSIVSDNGSLTSIGRGVGTASITRNSISFSTGFVLNAYPVTYSGSIKFKKRGMSVHNILNSGGGITTPFIYELQRASPRK